MKTRLTKLTKPERKALRFAHSLICGKETAYNRYTHGLVLRRAGTQLLIRPAGWIIPDQDPEHPYLNETVFSHLTMLGYMEYTYIAHSQTWSYRITRYGCITMGWKWPYEHRSENGHITPYLRQQQQEAFRTGLFQSQRRTFYKYQARNVELYRKHHLYHRLHK